MQCLLKYSLDSCNTSIRYSRAVLLIEVQSVTDHELVGALAGGGAWEGARRVVLSDAGPQANPHGPRPGQPAVSWLAAQPRLTTKPTYSGANCSFRRSCLSRSVAVACEAARGGGGLRRWYDDPLLLSV